MPVGVYGFEFDAQKSSSDCSGDRFEIVLRIIDADKRCRFGETIAGEKDVELQLRAGARNQVYGNMRLTGMPNAETRQIELRAARMVEERVEERRRAHENRNAVRLDLSQHRFGIEHGHRTDCHACKQCRYPSGAIAERMEERIDDQRAIAALKIVRSIPHADHPERLAVRMHRTLRMARRA